VGKELISSPDNEAVKHLRRLAHRRSRGEALLEGPRVVREAADAGVALELLAVREGDRFAAPAERTVVLEEGLFNALSQTITPQGVMAVARVVERPFKDVLQAARKARWPLVVLDGVQDPGNVGTICRTAAAAGAPALAVLPGTADPFGAKAVRASAGNVFRLLVARATASDLEGLKAVGASASGGAPLLTAPLEKADVLLLGSEAHGLSRSDVELVTIPVADEVESLNVAAAAAVLLFEIRRRRPA
jgi:TrmH family RNA methyltransferase